MSVATTARSEGLALALDDGTRKSHSVAENTAFVTGFFRGMSNEESFSRLVCALYFIYEAMESSLDTTENAEVKALDYPELRRLAFLEKDMEYFFGPEWRHQAKPSPATRKYVKQIRDVAAEDPLLLIGHQYSRYLGDLFGGQMMAGMATKSMGLKSEDGGIDFYAFPKIKDTKAFIEMWYSSLNQLNISEARKQEIVDEANVVFSLNIAVFEELEGSAFQAVWLMAFSTFKEKLHESNPYLRTALRL